MENAVFWDVVPCWPTYNAVPRSRIFLYSSEMSHIPEDDIFLNHRSEDFKSYIREQPDWTSPEYEPVACFCNNYDELPDSF
jgi:hypothetical protein